jgi:hypothetical protein
MKFGKVVARGGVRTFPLTRQPPVDNFGAVRPFVSLDYGEEAQFVIAQARSPRDQTAWVGYVCPGRDQDQRNQGTGGVYEIDHETYQTRKLA